MNNEIKADSGTSSPTFVNNHVVRSPFELLDFWKRKLNNILETSLNERTAKKRSEQLTIQYRQLRECMLELQDVIKGDAQRSKACRSLRQNYSKAKLKI